MERSMVSNIPILRNVLPLSSENNRLVTKAGEIVDVWMSLISGEQLQFLVKELNRAWESLCVGTSDLVAWNDHSLKKEKWNIRTTHKYLTKRRLERRVANENERYGYMHSFVTFMGYGMESVRSLIGRWVTGGEGRCGDGLFEEVRSCEQEGCKENTTAFEFEPSRDIRNCLTGENRITILKRRAVQVRLIWELQQYMEQKLRTEEDLEVKKIGTGIAILFILSFPGLCVDIREPNAICKLEEQKEEVRINLREDRKHHVDMAVKVMCGVQKVAVRLNIAEGMKRKVTLLWEEENAQFKWKWWRDSFVGRLEGVKEWQKDLNIHSFGIGDANSRVYRSGTENSSSLKTITDRYFRTWNEWNGFRGGKRKFELESPGFLHQLNATGAKEAGFLDKRVARTVASLPMQRMEPVSYAYANEVVLKHSCTLVEERLKNRDENEAEQEIGSDIARERIGRNLVDLSKRIEKREALMVLEIAATEYEIGEALRQFVSMQLNDCEMKRTMLEVTHVLKCYQAGNFCGTDRNLRVKEEQESRLGMVLEMCERMINVCNGLEEEVQEISEILVTCLTVDFKGMSSIHEMVTELCFGKYRKFDSSVKSSETFEKDRDDFKKTINAFAKKR